MNSDFVINYILINKNFLKPIFLKFIFLYIILNHCIKSLHFSLYFVSLTKPPILTLITSNTRRQHDM